MIAVEDLSVAYGAVRALESVYLRVDEGETVAVLGANGAGKTSLLRTISGLVTPQTGDIRLGGESLLRLAPEKIVRKGISHVPEGRRMIGHLTVRENLELAAAPWRRRGASITADLDHIHGLFPILADRAKQHSFSLSGGEQQMLAIGRGLMARPKVMLLDEPSLGLAPVIVETVFAKLATIAKGGTTLLIVEQNAHKALGIADRVYVLSQGEVVLEGTPDDVRDDPAMADAYLGA
jgi:branched-chain amino acid transport system ATP-binding protein